MAIETVEEVLLSGTPISSGIAVGNVSIVMREFHKNMSHYKIDGHEIFHEVARVKQAMQLVILVIEHSQKLVSGHPESKIHGIFAFQQSLLEDKDFRKKVYENVENKRYRAETAIRTTLDEYRRRITGSGSQIIRERASDLIDLKHSLVDALFNPNSLLPGKISKHPVGKKDRIAVCKELTPRLVLEQHAEQTKGVLSEHGGKTSHAAILCRALGIPAVSDIPGLHHILSNGTTVLVNGQNGKVVLSPTDMTISQELSAEDEKKSNVSASLPLEQFRVMANINLAQNVSDSLNAKADGIGLYRTEFEFLLADRILSEEEQFDRYRFVIRMMKGLPVHIRLLDIQDEKPYSIFHAEEGYASSHGAQFLLHNPEVVKSQARAIARASEYGKVGVIYPMIAHPDQFMDLRHLFDEAISDLPATGSIRHGAMFELPSACLQAREIFQLADFGSIGTNDLSRYLFGLDRNHENKLSEEIVNSPVIWNMIEDVVKAARQTKRPILFCGELANEPKHVPRLIEMGINTISVAPQSIPLLREAARAFLSNTKDRETDYEIEKIDSSQTQKDVSARHKKWLQAISG